MSVLRTFSKLRRDCSYPEVIEKKFNYARDKAAGIGTYFHSEVSRYIVGILSGGEWVPDLGDEDTLVGAWLRRLTGAWMPPAGTETEVSLGLALDINWEPCYVPVTETEPNSHVYIPDDGVTQLLTAGRADLIQPGMRWAIHVDDFKTGTTYWGDPKLVPQLLAQGIAATLRADAGGFVPGIYYARLGLWDRGDGEAIWRDTKEWYAAWQIVVASAQRDLTPRVGGHCLGCYSKADCFAYKEVVVTL